jgi:uncharacterized membrane protein
MQKQQRLVISVIFALSRAITVQTKRIPVLASLLLIGSIVSFCKTSLGVKRA